MTVTLGAIPAPLYGVVMDDCHIVELVESAPLESGV